MLAVFARALRRSHRGLLCLTALAAVSLIIGCGAKAERSAASADDSPQELSLLDESTAAESSLAEAAGDRQAAIQPPLSPTTWPPSPSQPPPSQPLPPAAPGGATSGGATSGGGFEVAPRPLEPAAAAPSNLGSGTSWDPTQSLALPPPLPLPLQSSTASPSASFAAPTSSATTSPTSSATASAPKRFENSASTGSLPSMAAAEDVLDALDAAAVPLATARPRADGAKPIDVYFATDRAPLADLIPGRLQLFGPLGVTCLAFCGLLIGCMMSHRLRFLWLLGCSTAATLVFLTGHQTLIRWQQVQRLATETDSVFSAARYESQQNYPLHLGKAQVTLPPQHQIGHVESPVAIKLEFTENAAKHVVLHSVKIQDTEAWFEAVREQTRSPDDLRANSPLAAGDGAFVFVHGYNVRFDDALKRTAQLSSDLGVRGPAICFSWPSRGVVAGYTADESTVNWSAPHFERLLLDLRSKSDCKSINVIAHSMGNRALLQAVERIGLRLEALAAHSHNTSPQTAPPKIIDQLIMAAPDVDVSAFKSRYALQLSKVVKHSTLYFSASDRALWLSQWIHGADRVGLVAGVDAPSGIDVVDIGGQSFFSVGHSYYGSDPAVISDLAAVLIHHRPAKERPWLQNHSSQTTGYWKLDRPLAAQAAAELLR